MDGARVTALTNRAADLLSVLARDVTRGVHACFHIRGSFDA